VACPFPVVTVRRSSIKISVRNIERREGCGQMKRKIKREFSVIIERDSEGYFVATVPELKGCHTQAKSLDSLMKRVREAIELCLEVEGDSVGSSEFIGVQRVGI
jgi:predicted RNase H-like HicB family nuclease